jgi:hypothetical protein
MSMNYDDDIREAESRLVRDRQALLAQAEDLTASARDLASSPKGLLAALAVGFVLGELTTPRRARRTPKKSQVTGTADTTAKMGLGGLIGSALFAYARSRYGSPWELGRSAWNYYAARQQTRRAAARARTPAPGSAPPAESTVVRPARAPAGSGTLSSAPAYSAPLRTPHHHAG